MIMSRSQMGHPKLLKLRPTQMTVGFAEVKEKQREWRAVPKEHREAFLVQRAFPAVLGPKGRFFITDHHHLGVALIQEEVERCVVNQIDDLSHLEPETFWTVMDHKQWVHAYDADGKRRPLAEIPGRLTELTDDPFRSLAAELRRNGGFAKETAPFAEFLWADFFRRTISPADAANPSDAVLDQALALCHTSGACHLPGWSGRSPR